MLDKRMLEMKKVYIFGAHSRGKTLKGYLEFLYPEVEIQAYIVDDITENELFIDGIPVYEFGQIHAWDASAVVFIATKGIFHAELQRRLESVGVQRVVPVTASVDNFLRNEYVKCFMAENGREFIKLDSLSVGAAGVKQSLKAKIYMAKSIYDKPLRTGVLLPEYVVPIQVGAGLTEERLDPGILTDCIGDNISHKNRQYSELTALYWMWKHAEEDVVGLCHYRRHFVLPKEWLSIMKANAVDVILPVPTLVLPNIAENYMERHDAEDWRFLMEYLEKNASEDFRVAQAVFAEKLYSPCNMFIMKREIMQELCEWMFPILTAVEEHGGVKQDTYQNRYPGFISERLITLFFYRMRGKYKIVYADKVFLS